MEVVMFYRMSDTVHIDAFQTNLHGTRILCQGPFVKGKLPPLTDNIQALRAPFKRKVLLTNTPFSTQFTPFGMEFCTSKRCNELAVYATYKKVNDDIVKHVKGDFYCINDALVCGRPFGTDFQLFNGRCACMKHIDEQAALNHKENGNQFYMSVDINALEFQPKKMLELLGRRFSVEGNEGVGN
jgi:hypothetical protein